MTDRPLPATAPTPGAPAAAATGSSPVDLEFADETAGALALTARLLLAPPDPQLLTALHGEDPASFPLANRPGALGAIAKLQVEAAGAVPGDGDALAQVCADEYERLFRGPGHVAATPFESVYTSEEHLVFQRSTALVRSWYAQHGLEWAHQSAEPDDHIGLEMEFLSVLIGRVLGEQNPGPLVDEARDFAREHLLTFAWDFQARLQGAARSAFYQGTAAYTAVVLAALEDLLGLADEVR